MLRRNPSLTEQAKAHLKQRILNGEFEAGRIPSEADLGSELNVSRSTIREALSQLETEGVIYRRQGSGTFVNETGLQIKTRLEEIWDYETVLEAHGYTPSTNILTIDRQVATADLVAELGLDPGDELLVVEKIFLADDNPVIFACNYIPTKIIRRTYDEDAFHLPLYQFLSEFCQQELTYYFSEILSCSVSKALRGKLDLNSAKKSLLSFEELGFNQDNEPIVKACSYFRDDVLRLRLIRRRVQ